VSPDHAVNIGDLELLEDVLRGVALRAVSPREAGTASLLARVFTAALQQLRFNFREPRGGR
jgi:hypothetical protein